MTNGTLAQQLENVFGRTTPRNTPEPGCALNGKPIIPSEVQSTSTEHTSTPPDERTLIWEGAGIFMVKISRGVRLLVSRHVGHSYAELERFTITGGHIKQFLHPADGMTEQTFQHLVNNNTKVLGHLQIWEKVYKKEDGTVVRHLYFDFTVSQEDSETVRATHFLNVQPERDASQSKAFKRRCSSCVRRIPVPDPYSGTVLIGKLRSQ